MVDDLTGKKLGRASSGTFRTADVVGLDTMAHVIKTLQDNLADDPFFPSYATPPVLATLIEQGALGQKTGAGFYKKVGKDILRLDPAKGDYVPGGGKADAIVDRMLKKPPAERLKLLRESSNPQAQFLWAILRDSFHYVAVHLGDIADCARDVDFAMRWGFGMKQGPFELWQAGRLDAGGRVGQGRHRRRQGAVQGAAAGLGVRGPGGRRRRRAPAPRARGARRTAASSRRSTLPVYERQPFPEAVLGSGAASPLEAGTEVFRNEEIRVWTLDGEVLIASITAKLHLISPTVTEGLLKAVEIAEAELPGPGDLVARRGVLGRRQPRGADAGLHEERRQGHRARGEEAAGRDAAHPLRAGAGGRRDARPGAGRRLRAGGALRAPRRAHGELRRPGRGRRRPDPGRRRPGLHRAPRGRDGRGRQRQRRPAEVPDRRLHQRGDGQGGHQRARVRASSATCCGAT